MDATPDPRRPGKNDRVEISPRKRKLDAMQERARSALTCGVCLELIPPPIQQCTEGHPICDGCFGKLTVRSNKRHCPSCRTPYSAKRLRNLIADQMAELIDYPCPHQSHGCNATMPPGELSRHAEACQYNPRMVRCPVPECNWRGSMCDLEAHVQRAGQLRMTEFSWVEHSCCYNLMTTASVTQDRLVSTLNIRLDGSMPDCPFTDDGPNLFFFGGCIFVASAKLVGDTFKVGLYRVSPVQDESLSRLTYKISIHEKQQQSGLQMWGPAAKLATNDNDMFKSSTCLSIDYATARSAFSFKKPSVFGHPGDVLPVSFSLIRSI